MLQNKIVPLLTLIEKVS